MSTFPMENPAVGVSSPDHQGTTYFSKEWWDTRDRSQKAVFEAGLFAPGLAVGRGVYFGIMATRAGSVVRGISAIKRPIHTLAASSRYGIPVSWTLGSGMKRGPAWVKRSLAIRKAAGLGIMGVSLINPLENIHYAREGDWRRLLVNYHVPIGGVAAYNWYISRSRGSSSQDLVQNGGPPGTKKRGQSSGDPPKTRKSSTSGGRPGGKKDCPQGHYWSWSKNTCVRSKYT